MQSKHIYWSDKIIQNICLAYCQFYISFLLLLYYYFFRFDLFDSFRFRFFFSCYNNLSPFNSFSVEAEWFSSYFFFWCNSQKFYIKLKLNYDWTIVFCRRIENSIFFIPNKYSIFKYISISDLREDLLSHVLHFTF